MIKKSSYKNLTLIGSIFIVIILITVVVLRVTGYWESKFDRKEKNTQNVNDVNITFIKNPDSVLNHIDYRLKELFYNLGPSGITSYQMTEGEVFAGTTGNYIIARTKNGEMIWLVDCVIDADMQVNILRALAVMYESEWNKAVANAMINGMKFPSPRLFRPEHYAMIKEDKLEFNGSNWDYFLK